MYKRAGISSFLGRYFLLSNPTPPIYRAILHACEFHNGNWKWNFFKKEIAKDEAISWV